MMIRVAALGRAGVRRALRPSTTPPARPVPTRLAPSASSQAEAMSALANLGYGPGEAATAVAEAAGAMPEADTPALIRAALRRLAPKG